MEKDNRKIKQIIGAAAVELVFGALYARHVIQPARKNNSLHKNVTTYIAGGVAGTTVIGFLFGVIDFFTAGALAALFIGSGVPQIQEEITAHSRELKKNDLDLKKAVEGRLHA